MLNCSTFPKKCPRENPGAIALLFFLFNDQDGVFTKPLVSFLSNFPTKYAPPSAGNVMRLEINPPNKPALRKPSSVI